MLWAHRDLLMIVEGFSETPGGSGECDRRVRDAAGDRRWQWHSRRAREEDSMSLSHQEGPWTGRDRRSGAGGDWAGAGVVRAGAARDSVF